MLGAQEPKTVKGAQSDPNYVSRLLLDCVPVFHKIITPAYLLYRSGPAAIYYSEMFAGGQKIIVTPLSADPSGFVSFVDVLVGDSVLKDFIQCFVVAVYASIQHGQLHVTAVVSPVSTPLASYLVHCGGHYQSCCPRFLVLVLLDAL